MLPYCQNSYLTLIELYLTLKELQAVFLKKDDYFNNVNHIEGHGKQNKKD